MPGILCSRIKEHISQNSTLFKRGKIENIFPIVSTLQMNGHIKLILQSLWGWLFHRCPFLSFPFFSYLFMPSCLFLPFPSFSFLFLLFPSFSFLFLFFLSFPSFSYLFMPSCLFLPFLSLSFLFLPFPFFPVFSFLFLPTVLKNCNSGGGG